tara:strand:+ start:899 stop:1957 length:1059 start_codon:yes stop_codon:yes gene_type:complete
MRNLKTLKYNLVIFFCFIGTLNWVNAQIGIGTESPDASSILEMKSDSMGVLVPRMTSTNVQSITTATDGLFLFDTDYKMMMMYGKATSGTSSEWLGLSPWRHREDVSKSTVNLYLEPTVQSVNIGSSVPLVGNKLTVESNMIVGANTGEAPGNGLLLVEDVELQSDLIVDNLAAATIVEGAGTVPIGGIIMWSGNVLSLPSGFELCEGGAPVNGITVPDLSGRFLVGVDDRETTAPTNTTGLVTNYGQVGNTGGLNEVTLITAQLPTHNHGGLTVVNAGTAHNHGFNDVYLNHDQSLQNDNDEDYRLGTLDSYTRTTVGAGQHSHTIYPAGSGNASGNRPKYFALAFIIRVQ